MPKASICISAKKETHLKSCLASALAQTYEDTEVLVSDCSEDPAIENICKTFSKTIDYQKCPASNRRAAIAHLIEQAKGDYVKILSDDQILDPFCIQRLVSAMEPGIVASFSDQRFIDENNDEIDAPFDRSMLHPFQIGGADVIRMAVVNHQNIAGSFAPMLFRRSACLDENGRCHLFSLDGGDCLELEELCALIKVASLGLLAKFPGGFSYSRLPSSNQGGKPASLRFFDELADRELFLAFAEKHGFLQNDHKVASYNTLIERIKRAAAIFPEERERLVLKIIELKNKLSQSP